MTKDTNSAEKTDEPGAPAAPAKAKSVRYIGQADVKSLTAEDWKTIHGGTQSDQTWSAANAFKIPADDFTKASLEFLAAQPDFVVK